MGIFVFGGYGFFDEGQANGQSADTAYVHGAYQNHFSGHGDSGGDAGGKTDGAKSRNNFEQYLHEIDITFGDGKQKCGHEDQRNGEKHNGIGLIYKFEGDRVLFDLDILFAGKSRQGRFEKDKKGCGLDPATGRTGRGSDKHKDDQDD